MLVPFYMLEGVISVIKEIKVLEGVEKWYEDEQGNRAIIVMEKKEG